MFSHLKKFGLLLIIMFVSIFAVFVFLHITSASAAHVLETEKSMSVSSPEQVNADLPGVGHWILVANAVSSNLSIINSVDNVAYGPFLQGQLGTNGGGRFDIAVTPDGMTALITNFGDSTVFFVNVADPIHPSLIATVTVPLYAEDMDISADGKYALVTDGGYQPKIASIDILSATLVYTADLGSRYANAVEIAPDGTVIVADYFLGSIHTLILDEMGVITYNNSYSYTYPGYAITDTYGVPRPMNVGLAPDGQTIIVCDGVTSTIGVYQIVAPGVLSFTRVVTGLQGTIQFDENTHPSVQSVAFNALGDQAYAVVNNLIFSATVQMDRLAVLHIDGPGQVSLEAGGVVSIPHHSRSPLFGVDTVAVAGNKVYLGYPAVSNDDDSTNVAVVDLSDYSVTTTLVLSKELFIPVGVTALPVRLGMRKFVSDRTPAPNQLVTYTLVLTNAGPQVTDVTILDAMPSGVQFVGPVTLYPPDAGIVGSAPPELVTSLVISAHQGIIVTFPVMALMQPDDTLVLNRAWAESPELRIPAMAEVGFLVERYKVYLPLSLKHFLP
jgi:uncharacterized repeat protein (TIGR01451 family)